MMVTKEQAIEGGVFHYGDCISSDVCVRCGLHKQTHPNSACSEGFKASKPHTERWRTNGQIKLWKTRPDEFRLPIKWGMRGYGYLTQNNAHQFHREADCPNNVSVEHVIDNWEEVQK